jgi:ketosteroid isomerase-like protein
MERAAGAREVPAGTSRRSGFRPAALRALTLALAFSAAVLLPSSVASGFDAAAEEVAVRKFFADAMDAYRRLDVDGLLRFYDDSALIVTYVMGRGDKAAFRREMEQDFSALARIEECTWEVVTVTFENELATVKVLSREKAVRKSGEALNRTDKYFYRLMKSEGAWKIYLQSYREDFGVTRIHGGHGGGSVQPALPGR